MKFNEEAKAAWTAYAKAVGGKSFNGDPLPTWEEMVASEDPKKKVIVNAWCEAANAVIKCYRSGY